MWDNTAVCVSMVLRVFMKFHCSLWA